jgi:hypothetical protein
MRTQLDAFATEQFAKLVSFPSSHLMPYSILCQIGAPILDALTRSLHTVKADPAERLTREFWAAEVKAGISKFEAARVWREMDYGEADCGHAVHQKTIHNLALMSCSANANGDVKDHINVRDAFIATNATLLTCYSAAALLDRNSRPRRLERYCPHRRYDRRALGERVC